MPRPSENGRIGFSIIELLVVIAIIAGVLAILIPGLRKQRATAHRITCTSNLRQIYIAMHMYINSNDDKYPCAQDPISTTPLYWLWMGRGLRGFISPYLGGKIDAKNPSVLLCPTDKVAPVKWESTSYSYSMAFYHSPEQIKDMNSIEHTYQPLYAVAYPPIPQKPVNVARPNGKIMVGEWLSNHKQIEDDTDMGWWCRKGQRNFLFADGQVQYLKAEDIRPANDGYPNPNLTKYGLQGIDWPK